MIAERSATVEVQSNITGQEFRAGIDDENMAHIINLFTDLYSDQQRAVIREYSTNARDAQIEAGIDAPIEVTLPSPLAPFFKVKDLGCGLDAEDIRKIYSRYGTSTKRATNDQNGMLGLGCKSALTYTEQFTVESVKDGMRTVCSISRGEDGVPVFTVVASVPDDAPNGTEVIVPVQRHHHDSFASKAAEFYSYWPADWKVLVNGDTPARAEGLRLGEGLLLVKQNGGYYDRKPHTVVMGGVAYPVDTGSAGLDIELPDAYRVIATTPIGSVTFTPSREALMYTRQTKDTLAKLFALVPGAVVKAVQAEIDNAPTARAAIQVALEHNDLLPRDRRSVTSFAFKGRPMPDKVDGTFTLAAFNSRKVGAHEVSRNGLGVSYMMRAMIVVGYNIEKFTATHKRKLLQYVSDNGLSEPGFFALTEFKPDMTWLDESQIVKWDDVRATKLPTTGAAAGVWRNGRPTGSYDAYIGGNFQHIQADEIDQDEAVYYCRALNRSEARDYAHIIGEHDPAATVVCLPENRHAKFVRNFPEALSYTAGLQAAYDAWRGSLSRGTLLALAIFDNSNTDTFKSLDPKRLDDPALRRACYIARNVSISDALNGRKKFARVLHAVTRAGTTVEWECPLERYTLVDHLNSYRGCGALKDPHLYIYLNAAYAAFSAGDIAAAS